MGYPRRARPHGAAPELLRVLLSVFDQPQLDPRGQVGDVLIDVALDEQRIDALGQCFLRLGALEGRFMLDVEQLLIGFVAALLRGSSMLPSSAASWFDRRVPMQNGCVQARISRVLHAEHATV